MRKPGIERETEKIARQMAARAGRPDDQWELFLMDAYQEYYATRKAPGWGEMGDDDSGVKE